MIEYAIKKLLLDNPAIWSEVNSRITPLERDKDGPLPAIVYESSEPRRERLLDGSFESLARITITFEIWAGTYLKAKNLADEVINTLESFSGNKEGIAIMLINCSATGEDKEFDAPTNVIELTANIIYSK
jgi:hypothetical protein